MSLSLIILSVELIRLIPTVLSFNVLFVIAFWLELVKEIPLVFLTKMLRETSE